MANASDVPEEYQDRVSLPKNADDGVVVADVEDRSPAASAGLKQFDTIIKINDKQVHSYLDIKSYLYSSTKPNDKVTLTILRDGKTMKKSIKLGRSEEHTSELQSRFELVCRLLLQKKYL